jgi:hypothetical protein
VFAGDLADFLLKRRPQLIWQGVDNWLHAERQPAAYKATGDIHANASLEQVRLWRGDAYERVTRYNGRAFIHEMDSLAAAPLIPDGSVDLIFVDADHSYDGCLADCRAWWPKVKPGGGWLGWHDYLNSDRRFAFGVNQAVDEFMVEVGLPLQPDNGTTVWMRKP